MGFSSRAGGGRSRQTPPLVQRTPCPLPACVCDLGPSAVRLRHELRNWLALNTPCGVHPLFTSATEDGAAAGSSDVASGPVSSQLPAFDSASAPPPGWHSFRRRPCM